MTETTQASSTSLSNNETKTKTTKKKTSVPPEDYKCNICKQSGHWIQQCPKKDEHNRQQRDSINGGQGKGRKRRQQKQHHVPVEGVDPSNEDIERARELQKIPPPLCYCGKKGRLKKVKQSHAYQGTSTTEQNNKKNKKSQQEEEYNSQSPAIGKYFYFCPKKKTDVTKCLFAKPLDTYDPQTEAYNVSSTTRTNKKPKRICRYFQQDTGCSKGDSCPFAHEEASEMKGASCTKTTTAAT